MSKRSGTTRDKVPVTMRSLVQRINRRLVKDDQQLRRPRGDGRARQNLGDYFVIDTRRNFVVTTDADPAALGRGLGCLQPWEQVIIEEEGA